MRSSIFNFNVWRTWRKDPAVSRRALLGLLGGALVLWILGAELLRWLFAGYQYPSIRELAVDALDEHTQVIFFGNSVVEANVDPRLYPVPVVGLPMANGNYEIDQMLLNAHLEKVPSCKVVVFEADVTCIGWDRIGITRDFLAFEQLGLSIWDIPRSLSFRTSQAFIESRWVRPYLFLPRLTPAQWIWQGPATAPESPRVPGFTPLSGKLLEPDIHRYFATETDRTPFDPTVVQRNREALEAMVKDLQVRGIQVVFLRYPSRGGYAFFRTPEWDQAMQELVGQIRQWEVQGVQYWDLSGDPAFSTDVFRDTIHLNQNGARILADLLQEKLQTILPVDSAP